MVTLRPYQTRAVRSLVRAARGIVQAPAGSGKTIIGAAAINAWLAETSAFSPSVIWLANTKEQCDQARAALDKFPMIQAVCSVTVTCYASGVPCAGADLAILDECHHIAAPEARKCLDGFTGVRWGLSATPLRADELANDVFELIGPIVCTIERNELVNAGQLAGGVVRFHAPNQNRGLETEIARKAEPLIAQRKKFWRVPEDEIRKRTLWQTCLELGIFENQARNDCITQLALDHAADSLLVLVGSIEHGELFHQRIPDAVMVNSGLGMKARRTIMDRFRARELRCLIATSLADEGLDLPCANVLILAAGGRSAAKAEQRTGRVLRAWKDKTHGLIHDFWDWQHFFLRAQSVARARVYESLGYQIELPEGITIPQTRKKTEPVTCI